MIYLNEQTISNIKNAVPSSNTEASVALVNELSNLSETDLYNHMQEISETLFVTFSSKQEYVEVCPNDFGGAKQLMPVNNGIKLEVTIPDYISKQQVIKTIRKITNPAAAMSEEYSKLEKYMP